MEALKWLDAPLQSLYLSSFPDITVINSTTFASWGTWKTSLQVLSLYVESDIRLEGVPFEWFTDMKQLNVECSIQPKLTKLTLSVNTFKGLRNLKKLQLNFFNIDLLSPSVDHMYLI